MRYFVAVMVSVWLFSAGWAFGGIPANVTLKVLTAPKGQELRAEAVVVRVNTSEQLKPIALELLDHLRSNYPTCRSYTLALSNDARMLKIGNYLAVATCKEGKVLVTGGIPTNMDIRVMMASRVEIHRPDEPGMQVAYEVGLLRMEAKKKGEPLTDARAYALIAGRHKKVKSQQIRQIDRGITQYYKAFQGKPF